MTRSEKHFWREKVQADWNLMSYMVSKDYADKKMVYEAQVEKSTEILDAFFGGISLVMLIAPPQWGKTGTLLYTAYRMTTHPDDNLMIKPDNVFIITGMSDKEWEEQTRSRMLPIFQKNVYHRNKFTEGVAAKIARNRDTFIVIDECHYGGEKDQTIHSRMKAAGLLDIEYLRSHNVKILCVSATPGSMLIDAQSWGEEHQRTVICKPSDTATYIGFDIMMTEKRLLNFKNEEGEFEKVLRAIETRWSGNPRWHIIRLLPKMDDIPTILTSRGYIYINHNSSDHRSDIDTLLSKQPAQHTFILIKGYWKAGKTFNDQYIGAAVDVTSDCNMAAQGLAGRLSGNGKQTGSLAPLIYCNINAIKDYIAWFNNGCNYYMSKSYKSAGFRIHNQQVKKKKDTIVHADEIANLVVDNGTAKPPPKSQKDTIIPRKVCIVADIGRYQGVPVATKMTQLNERDFISKFGLSEIPNSAKSLSKNLASKGYNANVSYKQTSMKDVANLVNFYKKKEWAGNKYHIILMDDDSFMVIERDIELLKSPKKGDKVIVHNHLLQLVLYEYIVHSL